MLNRYSYARNNPLLYIDPTGFTTELNEVTGEVMNVINDGDTSILAFPYVNGKRAQGPAQLIGDSYRVDTFTAGDLVNIGVDKTDELYKSAKSKYEPNIITGLNSGSGEKYDIKTTWGYKDTDGFKFEGKYATMRDLGNILAGLNARIGNTDFWKFQRMAGAVHQGHGDLKGLTQAYFGKNFSTPTEPFYGEIERQYRFSRFGYYKIYPLYKKWKEKQ